MSWTVTIKYMRPNTGVDWHGHGAEDLAYVNTNYVDNGKRTTLTSSVSDDGLESTKTYVYRDNAAYIEYITDDRVKSFVQEQITYNLTNDIDSTRSSEET